ncbi:MAG TPA: hypothetical protein DDZ89_10670 [Clostridiales bacterium]|nr:hypothetical protein [Clostridiales bacterium]
MYDYETQKIVHQESLKDYGGVVRQGMVYKHERIYLLMSRAILKINPSDYTIEGVIKLQKSATSGIAVTDEAVYFCSGPKVYKALLKFD